jgi:hypothetical protein
LKNYVAQDSAAATVYYKTLRANRSWYTYCGAGMGTDSIIRVIENLEGLLPAANGIEWKYHSNVMDYMKLMKVVCYFDDFFSQEGVGKCLVPLRGSPGVINFNGTGNCPEVIFFARSSRTEIEIPQFGYNKAISYFDTVYIYIYIYIYIYEYICTNCLYRNMTCV